MSLAFRVRLSQILALAASVLIPLSALPAARAEGGTWPPLGQMGWGRPYRVAVDGGYAYVAARSALTILDISAPSQPRMVGYWDDRFYARGVAVSGGYAYVADLYVGLSVVDVADPAHPVEAGYCGTPGGSEDVAVSGDYAYVVGGSGLHVVDVSDPAHPVQTGNLPIAPGDKALCVELSGGYAYIGTRTCVARIAISNPANPVLVGSVATPGQCWGLAVSGTYAYAAVSDQGMWVFDMADFTVVGSLPTEGYDQDVAASGSYAYVGTNAAEGGLLRVVDVSDPAHPAEVAHCDGYRNIYGVALADGLAYVANDWAGVRIVDVSDPELPAEVGYCDTNGGGRDVVVFGSHVYTGGSRGLRVTNVSNPAHPVATSYSDPHAVGAAYLAASSTYLYVGGHVGGDTPTTGVPSMRVMDLSDPAHPAQVGSCVPSDFPGGLAVAGAHVYAACQNGLAVINVSTAASPAQVAFLPMTLTDQTVAIAIIGEYAYVAAYGSPALWIIDVSNPMNPVPVGPWASSAPIYGLDTVAGYLYVSDATGVRVLDVSNPSAPVQVAYWPMPDWAYQVAVAGTYAYVADKGSGLRILDISNPISPTQVAYWDTPGDAGAVVAAGGYVYVGDYRWGLIVFRKFTPGTVAGQVRVKGTMTTIAGATVQARMGGILRGSATTNVNGLYTITNLPPGTYAVTARRQGYVSKTKTGITVAAGHTTPLDFGLDLSARLTGKVTDLVTGAAMSGVAVTASVGGVAKASATTAANGIYVIDRDLPTGTYVVAASKAGYLPQTKANIAATGGQTTYVHFWLDPQCLNGFVAVAGSTTRIAGAGISVSLGGVLKGTAITDPNGIYQIGAHQIGLSAAGSYTVAAAKAGFVHQGKSVTLTPGALAHLNLSLPVSGNLRGWVKDKGTSAYIAGATVEAYQGGILRATATTNAGGNYYIDRDLPAGTYRVKASATGYSPLTKTSIKVTAGATTWVYFALQP